VDNILLLVFKDHEEEVGILDKINVQELGRQEGQAYPLHQIHSGIVNGYGIVRPVILENQNISGNPADNLKIRFPGIVLLRFGIGNMLGLDKNGQKKKQA